MKIKEIIEIKIIFVTWPDSNWSPPNADTQGLIPPVPRAISIKPIYGPALE